jgi:hypothetical protein
MGVIQIHPASASNVTSRNGEHRPKQSLVFAGPHRTWIVDSGQGRPPLRYAALLNFEIQ